MNIQELYFYSYIYKRIYLANKDSEQGFDSFIRYAALRGCLTEKLYNAEAIDNDGLCGIIPEDKALYHINLALNNQNDVKEAIAHLKKAVGYFPAFKNEIGRILGKIEKAGKVSEKSSKDSELVMLAEQVKKNAEKLIMLEQYKDAEMLLKEILKYVPDDSEILDLIQLCNNK